MKPEKILTSNVLDIVFENRNKDYGAYTLRKYYNTRLQKSLGITTLIVAAFAITQSFKIPNTKNLQGNSLDTFKLVTVVLPTNDVKPTPKSDINKQPKTQQANAATAVYSKPEIVPDVFANNKMSTIDKVDTSLIAPFESDGKKITTEVNITKDKPENGNDKTAGKKTGDDDDDELNIVKNFAEIMPEFPGGKDALVKYMQKNLVQPTDFEDEQKEIVIAKFVVNKDGEIADIEIEKSARKDLDEQVVKVIKKMPKWKAGLQNGRPVAVFYRIPITFVAN